MFAFRQPTCNRSNKALSLTEYAIASRGCHFLILLLGLQLSHLACAEEVKSSQLYSRVIKPLFAEKCVACHGALKQESGLRLDHGSFIRAGGDSGRVLAISAGAEAADAEDADQSELLRRVLSQEDGEQMPPHGEGAPLDHEQLQSLRSWIQAGAATPSDEQMPVEPDQHWAWQPPRPYLPTTAGAKTRTTEIDENGDESTSANNKFEAWQQSPIDRLIAEQYQDGCLDTAGDKLDVAVGLTPAPLADPRTRVRRLYFDVIGLPPPPKVLQDFEDNPTRDAWKSLVDRLLASPEYGERWARHWMDVWRYSDWDGYKNEVRGSQRHIWRWRDWIVRSLNEDKGYDRMVMEMLAGDELSPTDKDALAATGFLVRNYHVSNRNIWLDATVEHTAKAFMGLTINCARCHDHKYDPISQREYYALRAIFEPHQVRTERIPGELDTVKDGLVRAFDEKLDVSTFLFLGGDEKRPDESAPVSPGVPELAGLEFAVSQVELPIEAVAPSLEPFVEQEELGAAEHKRTRAQADLEKVIAETSRAASESKGLFESRIDVARHQLTVAEAELKSLESRWQADRYRVTHRIQPAAYASDQNFSPLREAARLDDASLKVAAAALKVAEANQRLVELRSKQGKEPDNEDRSALGKAESELAAKREALENAKHLHTALMDAKSNAEANDADSSEKGDQELGYPPTIKEFPRQSTGRRLALAKWIVDQRNPLTARVAVNYVWMHHFGRPIVDNVFDFGMRSPVPEHLRMLDWLSVEFMRNDWSFKHLHRLITTSRAYQLSSDPSSLSVVNKRKNQQLDPDNRFLWRGNVRRLQAEVVRDSLLAVSGNLDRTIGGPEIDFSSGETIYRRSLYFRTAYEKQMSMLVIFDAAAPNECYRRSESIVPQQALALSNSPLALDQARNLARILWSDADAAASEDDAILNQAFEVLLGRCCTREELMQCRVFLRQQEDLLKDTGALTQFGGAAKCLTQPSTDPALRARENLIHALINHNDFVTVR